MAAKRRIHDSRVSRVAHCSSTLGARHCSASVHWPRLTTRHQTSDVTPATRSSPSSCTTSRFDESLHELSNISSILSPLQPRTRSHRIASHRIASLVWRATCSLRRAACGDTLLLFLFILHSSSAALSFFLSFFLFFLSLFVSLFFFLFFFLLFSHACTLSAYAIVSSMLFACLYLPLPLLFIFLSSFSLAQSMLYARAT